MTDSITTITITPEFEITLPTPIVLKGPAKTGMTDGRNLLKMIKNLELEKEPKCPS